MVHVLIERTNSRLTSTIHQVFLTRELLSHFSAFVDTTQLEVIQRNGDIYIRTLPYVEASGLPTSTNLLYLRWMTMTTAASSLLQRPPVHGRKMSLDLSIFFSERGARKGGGALAGPPRIEKTEPRATFSSPRVGGAGGTYRRIGHPRPDCKNQ